MKENVDRESSSIVIPALISGVVGAGLALLLTPKSGKEIRQDLGRLAKRAGAQADESTEEGKVAASEAVRTGEESIAESKEQLSAMAAEEPKSSLLVPILVSGIVGASLALLFAPKSGKEVMEDIKDLASNAVDKGKDLYDQGVTAVKDAWEKGKEAAVEGKERLRPAA
jgi:gas vesicle protein